MPIDATIPLSGKNPSFDETLKPLASMLSYQANAANLKELNAIRALANDPSVKNDDGSLNLDKFTSKAQVVAPTLGAHVAQANLGNQTTQIANKTSQFALDKGYMQTALETASGLLNDPRINPDDPSKYSDKDAADALEQAHNQMIAKGVPKSQALLAVSPFMINVHKPGAVAQMLKNTIMGSMNSQAQAGVSQPSYADNGQQLTNTNPFSNGEAIQRQLPPTTQVIGPNNTPGYLGPQGGLATGAEGLDISKLTPQQQAYLMQKNPQAFSNGVQHFQNTASKQANPGFVASGVPVGAAEGIAGTQDTINKHWQSTISDASTAAQDIGVLQNIKQHAAGAVTGVNSDREALIKGIAGKLGVSEAELAKTETDLLAKNANMLALAGGNTDAARTLAAAMNPNSHMTKEAIMQAADQIIAQKKMAIAQQKFLLPFKGMADSGHPEVYNNALSQFNSVADPRIFQLQQMSPEEKVKMKASMSPSERKEFGDKIRKLQSLGVLQ